MHKSGLIKEYKANPEILYLKIEAEGFEPEVIYGLGNIILRLIVVDATLATTDLVLIREFKITYKT
jgi:hypothetical protein